MIRFYLLQYLTKQTMCHATGMRANYWHSSESQMWLNLCLQALEVNSDRLKQ